MQILIMAAIDKYIIYIINITIWTYDYILLKFYKDLVHLWHIVLMIFMRI